MPTVSWPHLPENTHPAAEGRDIKIDQVVIGSCTNGRIEDMEAAYNILKGRHIADGVRGIIIPATMEVYRTCIERGYTTAFVDAGCIVSTPTCGPCLGGLHGHSGGRGAVRLHHQPQLCGPHGPREHIDKTFITRVQAGDIMVGGENFRLRLQPGSTRPWPSRPPASPASSPPALPGFSTAMPSTSVCPSWSARQPAPQPSGGATVLSAEL